VGGVLEAIAELASARLEEVEEVVGPVSFSRGQAYARSNRVLSVDWDPEEATLSGSVIGKGGLYSTAAYFIEQGGELVFEEGECSCPVGYNCKHVAALVVAGSRTGGGAASRRGGALRLVDPEAARTQPAGSSWDARLRALIDPPRVDLAGNPLAFELGLEHVGSARGGTRLVARLMRPGARGGWVNGSLNWSGLDTWQVKDGHYRQDHLALARDAYAIHRARSARSYYYGYGAEKTLDLSDWEEAQLWALLDQAMRAGVVLLHSHPALGELPRYQRGRVVIDVRREDERRFLARAALELEGAEAHGLEPVRFLGSPGHGLVCAEPGAADLARRRLQLVRLTRPAPAALAQMLLDDEPVVIPAAELERFTDELCPALGRVAAVVSSDGAFSPPQVTGPELALRVAFRPEHRVEVGWEWVYQVGDRVRRVPATPSPDLAGFRDLDAECAVLAQTALSGTGLEDFGLLDGGGRPLAGGPASLTGIDSLRFATEALPRLHELDWLSVAVEGEPADYRDVGESLTIGVSTRDIAGERDWFDLGVTIAVEGRELPFAEVFAALARGESVMLLPDGAHFSLRSPKLQSLRQLIEEARALSDTPASLRISRYQASLWSELVALGVVTEQAQAWQRQVQTLLELDALVDHPPPDELAAQLRPYQREGFGWLAALWELELGGILADDMGLGKTLQTLALICHAGRADPTLGPFLVVAPTSVVPGWVAEARRFAPGLEVAAVSDTLARSGRTIEEVATADVVVTTYTLCRLEADAYRSVHWAGVVLDEAQYVKNHQAKTYRCVRELPAPFKLAITGTPMENNLMELWSLLSITAPGLFPDPARFAEQYARPIERRGDGEQLARLRRRIKPLLKRRTKELVAADLPAKQEQTLTVALTPRHRKLYDVRLQRERQKILGLIDDFDRNRFTILRSITLLRQLSLHAGLVDPAHDRVPCAKLAALVEQLEEVIGGGHRALVFSQFTGFLARVRDRLEHEGIDFCYLDGRTRRRERVLSEFKRGRQPVFLISLKAGGFGLNLTEADYCFLLDPWWNPATETQAIDRTHRIGQTRPVMVYRLISEDTIEEKVVALARRKAALFAGVMDDGDLFASTLTAEDIRGLLG
jgi:superfamily II DNA or RNA helicase